MQESQRTSLSDTIFFFLVFHFLQYAPVMTQVAPGVF